MARLVRVMSDAQRETVAHWHRTLTTGLEGAVPQLKRETAEALTGAGLTGSEAAAAAGGAEGGLLAWLRTMRQVAELLADPSPGDWCCKPGMLADPRPCPQHGYLPGQDSSYELGTIIRRAYGHGEERAVKVYDDSDYPHPWRSVEFPLSYNSEDLTKGHWTVVGRV
jgi:hypothetical protein